jgi:hypothetical protein
VKTKVRVARQREVEAVGTPRSEAQVDPLLELILGDLGDFEELPASQKVGVEVVEKVHRMRLGSSCSEVEALV